jgi:cytochrome d ubiquinol oxidase subunit II
MTVPDLVAAVMFVAVVAYSVFGGADFGSGVWDLLAGDARRGAAARRLVDHAIGPVWEANHVWLIFVLVFLWTGFPGPFSILIQALAVPFWLVGLGVVLRGAGFALRKYAPTLAAARVAGVTFALSSLITPFFLGSIAGAVASGRVRSDDPNLGLDVALSPSSLVGGVLAVLTCTFLAGVFLAAEADRTDDTELATTLRQRSFLVGAITGVVALAAVVPLSSDAPVLVDGLTGKAAPVVGVSAVAGAITLALLHRGATALARVGAVVAVAAVVTGWGVGQYPWILVDEVTIAEGAGARATLVGLLVAAGLAAVLVVPALVLLFVLADGNRVGSWDEESSGVDPRAPATGDGRPAGIRSTGR